MLGVLRTAARQAKPALRGVRRMSSNIDFATEAKEASKWKIVTFAALPVVAGLIVANFSGPHEHFEKPPPYPYMHIRTKEFPWGPDGLFETVEEHEHAAH